MTGLIPAAVLRQFCAVLVMLSLDHFLIPVMVPASHASARILVDQHRPTGLWITSLGPLHDTITPLNERFHREVCAMLCVVCGAQMNLVEVRGDDTMMVRGYEHHTFECTGCREIERRLIFSPAKRALTGRIVQICHDPQKATYAAKDTKSGMVVMRNQDHQCLRELCEWIGWGVVNGKVPRLP